MSENTRSDEELKNLKARYFDLLTQIEIHSGLILKHRDMIERLKTELDRIKKEIVG